MFIKIYSKEGNFNSSVKWGRVITLDEVKKTGVYMITRYPL